MRALVLSMLTLASIAAAMVFLPLGLGLGLITLGLFADQGGSRIHRSMNDLANIMLETNIMHESHPLVI